VSDLVAAIRFLTRVPIGAGDLREDDLAGSVAWFPVVGALIGAIVAASYAVLLWVVPDLVAATLAMTVGVLITGAIHEDGLADTADAFGAGVSREETLRIMKDPNHGSYGVIALLLSLILRLLALGTIDAVSALLILPAIHALSRAGAVTLIGALPAATGDGLGAAHSHPRSTRSAVIGSFAAVGIALALLGWWALAFAVVAGASALVVGMLASRRISGFTGDVLGAAEQVTEIGLFVLGAALVRVGLVSGPWWSS